MDQGFDGDRRCPWGAGQPQRSAAWLYGVHAVCSGVQLNMLRKWMGHASINTTSIYANAMGKEELQIADRMWV